MSRLRIPVPSPFAFPETVVSHGWYLLPPFRWDRIRQLLHRAENVAGRAIDLTIGFDSTLIVRSPETLPPLEPILAERIGRMFQLHVDMREFIQRCRDSSTHQHVTVENCGRLLCGSNRFEDVVKIIATTNTTWRQTVRMVELFVVNFGSRAASGHSAFPTPEQIAAAPLARLRDCKLGYRATSIKTIASEIVEGSIDLDALADPAQSTPELLRSFEQLPGIGPYGAAHLAAMEGRYDFIAVDTEFRRFVRERYHRGRQVRDSTLLRHYRGWGRWKYLAYWSELWDSVAPGLQKTNEDSKRNYDS